MTFPTSCCPVVLNLRLYCQGHRTRQFWRLKLITSPLKVNFGFRYNNQIYIQMTYLSNPGHSLSKLNQTLTDRARERTREGLNRNI